jgi:hypothetical protein
LGRFLKPLRRLWMRPFVLGPEDLTEEVVEDAGKSTPAAVTKTLGVVRREIARGRLARQAGVIKVPILVVVGEEDQIVDPQAASDWAQTVSAEVTFLNECGHLPMLERTGEFNARVFAFLTGDPRYLDTATETLEEVVGEGAAEPANHPSVASSRGDSYPSRDRDPKDLHDDDVSDPSVGRRSDGVAGPTAGDGTEGRAQDHTERPGNEGDAGEPVPEVPKDLLEWPEFFKEFRPRGRSPETGRQERDEEADLEGPEKEPPRS